MDAGDKKVLQGVVSGIGLIHQDIQIIKKDMKSMEERLNEKMDAGFEKVNSRIDKLGFQLAELEDDAPTREEFDELGEKVTKLQRQFLTN